MENSKNKSAEQVNYENDILAQIQGYPDFASAPKGDPTKDAEEIIQHINDQLNLIPDEFYLAYYDEQMMRAIEDPNHQEEAMRLVQFWNLNKN